jgi:hypothetical protein
MEFSRREVATLLAALREWQGILAGQEPPEDEVDAIASANGSVIPLNVEEIGELCERINRSK